MSWARPRTTRLAAAAQEPDVETLGFGDPRIGTLPGGRARPNEAGTVLDRYRQVVSGAHLSGAKEITNEWGAVLNGQFGSGWRTSGPRRPLLAAGVSRMALTASPIGPTASRRRRTVDAALAGMVRVVRAGLEFADSWNQRWPLLKACRWPGSTSAVPARRPVAARRAWTSRCSTRRPRRRHRRHRPGPGESGGPPARGLHSAGFTWDAMTPLRLPDAGGVSRGRLLPVARPTRRWSSTTWRDPGAAARRLFALAHEACPSCSTAGCRRGPASMTRAREDAAVRAASSAGCARCATSAWRGRSRSWSATLGALEVRPDLGQAVPQASSAAPPDGDGRRLVPLQRLDATRDAPAPFATREARRRRSTCGPGAPRASGATSGERARQRPVEHRLGGDGGARLRPPPHRRPEHDQHDGGHRARGRSRLVLRDDQAAGGRGPRDGRRVNATLPSAARRTDRPRPVAPGGHDRAAVR